MESTESPPSDERFDYKKHDVVEARIREMLQRVEEKTKSAHNEDELLKACHALIGVVTSHPRFRQLKLSAAESVAFPPESQERPSTESLEELLSPWLDLADFAYKYHNDGSPLEEEIQKLLGPQWRIMRHSTAVETGGVGYYLAVSPAEKKILIGIKGTSTMSEMITDCLATTMPHRCVPHSPFDSTKDEPEEIGAHEGILASSIKLSEELKPILDDKIPQGYSIELTGHSLGAGAASVLAVLLRAKYTELHEPNRLHAYCFATPPVLGYDAAAKCKSFITSIVNRNDCVTRMSIANVEVLVKMLEGFNEEVMKKEGLNTYWEIAKEINFGHKMKNLSDEQFAELVGLLVYAQAAVPIEDKEHLYVPGKVIAFYGTMKGMPANGEKAIVQVKAAILDPAHPFLRYFEVNDRMFYDHGFVSYRESLTGAIEHTGQTEKAETERGCRWCCATCCLCTMWLCNQICCCPCHIIQKSRKKNATNSAEENT